MFEKIKLLFKHQPVALPTAMPAVLPEVISHPLMTESLLCPYCASKNFVKRGWRLKKLEKVQLLLCMDCHKTFTPQSVHGKHYPLATIFDAISLYNLGYSLEESCRRINIKNKILNIKNTNKNSKMDDGGSEFPIDRPATDVATVVTEASSNGTDYQKIKTISAAGSSATPSSNYQSSTSSANVSSRETNNEAMKPSQTWLTQFNNSAIQPSTLSAWLTEFKDNLPFLRMRDFATAKYQPQGMVITATLAHRQLYRYRFHRAKCAIIMQENFHHRIYAPLVEFLEMVPGECPHQYFQDGLRASEAPLTFSKIAMIVRGKQNFATQLATFVVQGAKERKNRHEILQKFMLYNDSVTVATEVPVYITRDDIEHMKTQLGFEIYNSKVKMQNAKLQVKSQNSENPVPAAEIDRDLSAKSLPKDSPPIGEADIAEIEDLPKLITGHIDILQIRNGQIHLLDYKPNAEKERPIEQLTLYAMALSRLTGLRLFEFKCAWFDEKDYFEFYPLHVLHKPKKARRRRTVATMEGTYQINRDVSKIKTIHATPY